MDNLTGKFTAYDFFNPIIAGMAFLIMQILCALCVFGNVDMFLAIYTNICNSIQSATISILVLLVMTYVIGAATQALMHYLFSLECFERFNHERNFIHNCLNNNELYRSSTRAGIIEDRAKNYLHIDQINPQDEKYEDYCKVFFSHCVYSLQIKNLDGKIERLRETGEISKILVGVFGEVPIISIVSILIWLWQDTAAVRNIDWASLVILYAISLLLCMGFEYRFRVASKNRIIMTLSIYDALCDDTKAKQEG